MNKYSLVSMAVVGGLMLTACGGSSNSNNDPDIGQAQPEATENVDFDFDLSALLDSVVPSGEVLNDALFFNDEASLMTGTMLVEDLDSNEIETHSWTVNLDENNLSNVESLKSLVLEPSSYSFSLVLERGQHQYVGTSVHTVEDGSQELVPMTIRPVIGDSQVSTEVVSELVDFRFNYNVSQLSDAGLVGPSIGITIDQGSELVFELDPATGLSEHMFLNLVPGTYDISLRLFDAGSQVGKSVPNQGVGASVSPGSNVTLDIVPLYGEVGLGLAVEGGNANMTIQVPAEVVEEAGDLSNLQTILSVVGPENPLQEVALSLVPVGANYEASVTLLEMYYGNLDFELAFSDIAEDEPLGTCVDSATLTRNQTTVECQLTLRTRSAIGGNLLSTVGLNVFDLGGAPVSGAVVNVDGEDIAITNSAIFSSPGYSKIYLNPGARDIVVRSGDSFGELAYTSVPLSVDNVDITLDQVEQQSALLLADSFDGTQSGIVTPMGYWFGCLAKGPHQGFIGGNSLFLGSRYNSTRSDWCWNTSALTLHNFTDTSIADAGGFVVSADIVQGADLNSRASVSIGGEIGSDPINFYPHLTVEAVVHVIDSQVLVEIYENGSVVNSLQIETGLPFSAVNNVKLIVRTNSFAAGAPGTIDVLINDDPSLHIPTASFIWDGGNNHIELRGSGGVSTNGSGIHYIEYGALEVSLLEPTIATTQTGSFTGCAIEGGVCSLTEASIVRYGANDVYVQQTFPAGDVPCNNNVFGDPLGGVTKSCAFLPIEANN